MGIYKINGYRFYLLICAYNISLAYIPEQERHGPYPHEAYSLWEKMTLNKYYIIIHNYEKCSEGNTIGRPNLEKWEEDSKLDSEELYLSQD